MNNISYDYIKENRICMIIKNYIYMIIKDTK